MGWLEELRKEQAQKEWERRVGRPAQPVISPPSWLAGQAGGEQVEAWQPEVTSEIKEEPVFTPIQRVQEDWATSLTGQPPSRMLPRMATAVAEPDVIPNIPTVDKPSEWYEKPKDWFETGSETIAKGISKVPVLPEALEKIAPAFQFIHEKLEKPWAAIITAPFSPALPWQAGESWIEHQKREFEAWKAPTYVKGAAEFSMPLWWMPWFTWAKGIKATVRGAKLARGLKAPEALALPSKEVLNASYGENWFRSLAHWAENKKGISGVVRAVGGESAFARNVGEVFPAMDVASRSLVVVNRAGVRVPVTDVVRREIVNQGILRDMRHGYKGLQLPRLQALAPRGDVASVLQVDDVGRVMAATPKKVTPVTPEVTIPKPTRIEIRNWRAAGFTDEDISSLSKMSLKLRELHTHQARMTGFRNVSNEAVDDYLQKALTLAKEVKDTKAIESIEDAIKFLKKGDLQDAIFESEKGLGYIHQSSGERLEHIAEMGRLQPVLRTIDDVLRFPESIKVAIPKAEIPKAGKIIPKVGKVTPVTPVGVDLGRGLSEVFENPDLYTYSSAQAEKIVREGHQILKEMFDLARKEGVALPEKPVFHRLVEGKNVVVGDRTVFEASEYGSRFEKARHYLTMEQGIQAGVIYGRDPVKSIAATIDHYFKRIAEKRFDDEVGKLGLTIPEMVSLVEPGLVEKIAELGTKIGSASYLAGTLKTLKSYRGDSIPGAVTSKIRRGMPEAMERIEQAFSISPQEATKLMDAIARTIQKETKINARSLKTIMGQFNRQPGKILAREIDDMVRSLNLTNATAIKATRQAYKAVYQSRKQFVDDTLKSVREEAEVLIKASKTELVPLKAEYRFLAQPFKEGTGQIFGGLAKFQRHKAFRNRIFDAEVVKLAEPILEQAGSKWLRGAAQVSGTGRLLVAALDFSAPFIQGLAVLGRNPVAWANGVAKQFKFFVHPDDFFQYMTQPHIRALAAERWAHGGSRSTFEFFEALAPMQRVAEKVPKIGATLKGAIRETYGRAETAFSGFGEVSRNSMWEALRVKALRPDGTLDVAVAREIARSIDRMTGVMSTEALAVPKSQVEFENAWLFFAPRYTRAGMSYVSDLMRGGIAGAEARKGLGSLTAAGMTYYYGVATALGQQPNLDITSPRFLTVKIGDDYVGVGGILYSLARLGANVIGTAADPEKRVDFTTLNRFDNPFVKFMFSRSSVLTGLTFGAVIEHKNFFGEPLESVGDWGKFLAEKALPIAMQRAILEPEHRNPAVFTSELLGGRTFPKSAWELQEEMKDRLAQTEEGLPYDDLDLLQRRRIDQHPEVTKFQEEIDEQTTRRGKGLSVAFMERRRDLDDARFMHKEAIENLQMAYDKGLKRGYEFKEGVIEANIGYGATYEHIQRNPRYAEVEKKLQEPREISREYRWELALDELMNANSLFENELGIFDFAGYNKFIEQLRVKYGDADFNRAIEFQREKYAEYPPLFQEWLKAKDALKPYWQVRDKVEQMFGRIYAESPHGQRLINKERERMRLLNPELERLRILFYTREQ